MAVCADKGGGSGGRAAPLRISFSFANVGLRRRGSSCPVEGLTRVLGSMSRWTSGEGTKATYRCQDGGLYEAPRGEKRSEEEKMDRRGNGDEETGQRE